MYTWKIYGGYAGHRTWGVYKPDGELLVVCCYRRGAVELCEHLNALCGAA